MVQTEGQPRKVPTAVTLVACFAFAAAILSLSAGLRGISANPDSTWSAAGLWSTLVAHTEAGAAARRDTYLVATALGLLLMTVGFLRLHRWAWTALMAWAGFSLAILLARAAIGSPIYPALAATSLAVFLLNLDAVRSAFRSSGTQVSSSPGRDQVRAGQ